jgi:hypothetical protein
LLAGGLFLGLCFAELEGDGVDAVALACGARAVVEDVAEVGSAVVACDFGAAHPEEVVVFGGDVLIGDGLEEAGPACAGLEFGVGAE